MSPFEFELRKQRFQELINAELLRRGSAPTPSYKPDPYLYRSAPEIIDVEWIEVVPVKPPPKKENLTPFYFIMAGLGVVLALSALVI